MKNKKFLSVMITLAMVLSMTTTMTTCVNAGTEENYCIFYNAADGKFYQTCDSADFTLSDEITALDSSQICSSDEDGDGTYETVTLNNFSFTSCGYAEIANTGLLCFSKAGADCNLVLAEGSVNTITSTAESASNFASLSCAGSSKLTISGKGTLKLTADAAYALAGNKSENNITIKGGATVYAESADTSAVNAAGITINDATLSAKTLSDGATAFCCYDSINGENATIDSINPDDSSKSAFTAYGDEAFTLPKNITLKGAFTSTCNVDTASFSFDNESCKTSVIDGSGNLCHKVTITFPSPDTYLDLDTGSSTYADNQTVELKYTLTTATDAGLYTDVTKVKIEWTTSDISANRKDAKKWNAETLSWDEDDANDITEIKVNGSAVFTLTNYSSVKVNAKVSFTTESGFTTNTITYSKDADKNGSVTLGTVVKDDKTIDNTIDHVSEIGVTVTPAKEDFASLDASTNTKYGTYTVTLSKYTDAE